MIRGGSLQPGQMDAMRPDLSAGNRLALEVADLMGVEPTVSDALAIADLYEVEDVDGLLTRLSWIYPSLGRKAF